MIGGSTSCRVIRMFSHVVSSTSLFPCRMFIRFVIKSDAEDLFSFHSLYSLRVSSKSVGRY